MIFLGVRKESAGRVKRKCVIKKIDLVKGEKSI